jgi:hypothetical protein
VPLLVIGFLVGFDANLIYQRVFEDKDAWQPWSDDEDCNPIDFWEAAEWGATTAPAPPVAKWWRHGKEFKGPAGFRGAPFGNRNPNRPSNPGDYPWPHYHQPGPKDPMEAELPVALLTAIDRMQNHRSIKVGKIVGGHREYGRDEEKNCGVL